jgi:hypothetical protein
MFPASILVGLLFLFLGILYWSEIRRTPKGKLIPWGIFGGAWMTRNAAYVTVVCLFFLAALCFFVGLTL